MGRLVDSDDLWDSAAVGRFLGLGTDDPTGAKGARGVSAYRRMYDDFPAPLYERSNAVIWVRQDVEAWRERHPSNRRKTDGP